MPTGFTSSYGFVLKYEEAIKYFQLPHIEDLKIKTLEDEPFIYIHHISSKRKIKVEFFYRDSSKGDCYDTLEDGWYFIIDENLLYQKKKTLLGKLLTKQKTFPNFQVWLNEG